MRQKECVALFILIVTGIQIAILFVSFNQQQKTQSDELERNFNWIHYPSKKKKERIIVLSLF